MVKIDYSLSSIWKLEKSKVDLATSSLNVLTFNAFTGSLIFKVNDADFSAQWNWIPILGFAREFFFTVESMSKKNLSIFEFTENDAEIILERNKAMIQISASYVEAKALVEYVELRTSALNFYKKVSNDFLERYPELSKNGHFSKLLSEVKNGKVQESFE